MKEHLWDGNIDCGWEELQHRVIDISNKFASDMLEIVSYSPYDITKELINQETMDRFRSLSRNLSEHISKGEYCEHEDIENKNDNAYRLTSWILLGSLTETVLQMFLAFYIDDYQRSKWRQWEDVDIDEVKNSIIDSINNLVTNKTITVSQGKSLKKAIKDKIKEHTVEHPVQRVMLDEIIGYYVSMELLDDDELSALKEIQSNRNGIHSFEGRTIGTWFDLQYCVRFWCYLLEWILERLPDIPDYS